MKKVIKLHRVSVISICQQHLWTSIEIEAGISNNMISSFIYWVELLSHSVLVHHSWLIFLFHSTMLSGWLIFLFRSTMLSGWLMSLSHSTVIIMASVCFIALCCETIILSLIYCIFSLVIVLTYRSLCLRVSYLITTQKNNLNIQSCVLVNRSNLRNS